MKLHRRLESGLAHRETIDVKLFWDGREGPSCAVAVRCRADFASRFSLAKNMGPIK